MLETVVKALHAEVQQLRRQLEDVLGTNLMLEAESKQKSDRITQLLQDVSALQGELNRRP